MSPFTGDSQVLTRVLDGSSEIWKSLSGPIESITISERSPQDGKADPQAVRSFVVSIKTIEIPSSIEGDPPSIPAREGRYRVTSKWDFMVLESVEVEEI